MADMAEKAVRQVDDFLTDLLAEKRTPEKARELAHTLSEGKWTHDYPITCDKLIAMGLPINSDFSPAIYDLMDLYPQPPQGRPSVQYIPLPYNKETFKKPL